MKIRVSISFLLQIQKYMTDNLEIITSNSIKFDPKLVENSKLLRSQTLEKIKFILSM
jgi:hypothetical protein